MKYLTLWRGLLTSLHARTGGNDKNTVAIYDGIKIVTRTHGRKLYPVHFCTPPEVTRTHGRKGFRTSSHGRAKAICWHRHTQAWGNLQAITIASYSYPGTSQEKSRYRLIALTSYSYSRAPALNLDIDYRKLQLHNNTYTIQHTQLHIHNI
jgi:hypothetical protein